MSEAPEDVPRLPPDSQLSQADTLAGDASAFGSPPLGTPILPATPTFPVRDWDRYECLGFLGQGGMGMVFHARDRKLGRDVAIKFVRVDGDRHLARFQVEARAQARVDHPHVCKVFEVGEVEGRVFITMQHIEGESLDVAARQLTLEEKVLILRDAARGLHEAHRMGIIHRDLKPSNIMVERGEDGTLQTFVMDFGLAHEWDHDVTETGSVLGTPAFMSPEQARGEVSRLDRRTDVYSLGATLYQVATGRSPVTGANALEILSAIASVDVPAMRSLRMDIPRDLEAITLKCLEKDRAKRYDSAKALADDLDRFLAGEPVLARPTGLWYRLQRKARKHKEVASVGLAALVIVMVATGMALKTRRDAARRERLAQRFTESMARIEAVTRYSALAPLHDIRPDLVSVRTQMAQLQADMAQAGSLANGPGHYALGRGYATLDDEEKAREHLQMAWDAGYREPRVAYALAVALGREYREKLLEAGRIPGADQRQARLKTLDATLRMPALDYLRQAKGTDLPAGYLEALMAFYEGGLDDALERLRVLGEDLPWFYEAPLLRGSLLQARAWNAWNKGERETAQADFNAGRATLLMAAASGRSAPSVHAALAELELNALIMEKYGQGQVEAAFRRGSVAIERALTAQPDHVPSLILQSELLRHFADFKANRGEKVEALARQAVAVAQKAQQAGPTRADAWAALGKAYYQWGSARQDQNLDPTEQLAQGLQAFETLSPDKRDYTVENHIGLIHQTWADFEEQRGRDATPHLSGAIEAYRRATQMEPHLLPAWINQGTCLQQRAALPAAADPEGDLQAALQVLDQAQSLNPKHFVPYFVKGKVSFELARRKRARGDNPEPDLLRSLEATRQGLAINDGIPHLHNGVGLAQLELARHQWESGRNPFPLLAQAQVSYRKAISVAPDQSHAYINLGDLLIWKARWEGLGAGALRTLSEADAALQKALSLSPGDKNALANLGRACAVRLELSLREGGEVAASLQRGEVYLARALAVAPHDPDILSYLGELRLAAVEGKAAHRVARAKDFRMAEAPLEAARREAQGSASMLLPLARLAWIQARWERLNHQDAKPTLQKAQLLVGKILAAHPRWGDPMALQAVLRLEEAETDASGARIKAAEAVRMFTEAFGLNTHLTSAWKAQAERAQALAGPRGSSS